jgi:cytochrome b
MEEKNNSIKVWDVFVRIFHWTLVGVMIGQYLTGDRFKNVHVKLGYFLICLVLARILWGFFGSKHASFSDFVYGPGTIITYLKGLNKGNPKHYLGHNPAGGIMIIILLFSLLVTSFTGLKILGSKGQGPLADEGISIVRLTYAYEDEHDDNDDQQTYRKGRGQKSKENEFWEEIHELMTGFMLFLIIVHISSVIVSSWVHKENLIFAMITGRKKKG